MRISFCILTSAALAGIASAWTTPTSADTGNSFYTPGLNQIVPVGAPFNVTWNPTTNGTVDLVLCHGPSSACIDMFAIATNIPNTGSYLWIPSLSIQPDTSNYGIQLIVDATGAYQYTDQFGISNAGNPYTTQSTNGQQEATTTTTEFSVTGSSTTAMSLIATAASTMASSSAIAMPSANSSTTYTVPSMVTSTTLVIPNGSSSTQTVASPTGSSAGARRMVEMHPAAILGFGGFLFVIL
ncbi:hypothetical protein MMC34_003250 [Xylographa carneopallida]|nr:hypothetical protein [Xylographa carneopallida]